MRINETLAGMQPQPVDDAGVRLRIVNHHVAAGQQRIDDRNHPLIPVVQQERVGLADECGQLPFELFVPLGLPAHHTRAHRIRHTEFGGGFGIGLPHLRVVGQPQVVIQAPVQYFPPAEHHPGTDFSFQFRKCEIAVCFFGILADITSLFFYSFKNVHVDNILKICRILYFNLAKVINKGKR